MMLMLRRKCSSLLIYLCLKNRRLIEAYFAELEFVSLTGVEFRGTSFALIQFSFCGHSAILS
ncbi:hypothetical protein PHJA_000831500 [Phtheirospermum japonicum]|uniref:Uncharacterized protein n=1 Tax=Phtheirospermum japonicum TaxID=374723 RepID=A0A830BHN9_9LAMI|nr:hypothetical protein PHJA_000831500 [Phtheirospermum japonicum]